MDTPARLTRILYLVVVLLLTFDLLTCVPSQVADCGSLTDPANGYVTQTSGTTFGQTATYTCNTGYNLVGDSTRICQATGQWSGSAPTCVVVDCGSLTDPANGQVNHTIGTILEQTATYSCNTGYNLVGDSTRSFQTTGVWSGSEHTVQASIPEKNIHPQTVGTTDPPQIVGTTFPPQIVGTTFPPQIVGTTFPPQTVEPTSPPQTVGATSPRQTVEPTSPRQTVRTTTPPQTVGTTSPSQTVGTTSPPQTVGTTSPPQTVGTTSPPQTVGATNTTGTASVSSSIQLTTNPPSDGVPTTPVIIVVAVVIILVVIVVGVVILVVIFRSKKRSQRLVINKFQNVTVENQDIEVKFKQEGTTKKEASSSDDHPLDEVSNLLYQSMDRYHDPPGTTNVPQGNNFYTVPNTTSSHTNEAVSENKLPYEVSNLLYQSMDQHRDPPSTKNVPQGNDVYTVPDTTSLHTIEMQSGAYETVYREPIQPSLFTDAPGNPGDSEDYASVY